MADEDDMLLLVLPPLVGCGVLVMLRWW